MAAPHVPQTDGSGVNISHTRKTCLSWDTCMCVLFESPCAPTGRLENFFMPYVLFERVICMWSDCGKGRKAFQLHCKLWTHSRTT